MPNRTTHSPPRSYTVPRISSFDQNPASGGMPEIASQPMAMVTKVTGILRASPPIRVMSCSPAMPWITEPAPRKSSALKKACVMRWNTPATWAAAPTAMNMNPSCEMVE